jgi:hypothetical protein
MSRTKGHNGAAVAALERSEDNSFALTRARQDLEIVKLRVRQALKRGGPKELLEPAVTLIDETIERISRASA